ncbi:hypothetical protein TON_1824 [Thermococcus onnurineus NA1]|uniref:Uncharacterized protein n=2 Tax=Thermococcus TaxID=2263 RepID=B6YVJ0_THEON|nr:carboxypeptidase-like regulatory domain-containing protein [Thermococcus onnurineus]ACJ17314.1 hypothetical protein TON_1824 [Thermococcus onnurineus NA1]
MNKCKKAQIFGLVLAFLILASVVPSFAPGFMTPVKAAGYITGISADTNYGGWVLFAGFEYFVNITINATQQTFANVTLYYIYQDGHNESVYSRVKPISTGSNTVLINSTDPGDIDPSYSKVPQDVERVTLVVYEYDIANGNIPYTGTIFEFNVRYPFTVVLQDIQSSVPYYNGTDWLNDKALEYIPFNMTVNVTYDPQLVNSSLITVPSSQIVNITLPDDSGPKVLQIIVNITDKTDPTLIQNNHGSAFVELSGGVNASDVVKVASTAGGYTYVNNSALTIYDWGLDYTYKVVPSATDDHTPYKYVPFDLYMNLTAVFAFGIVGVNDTASVVVTSDVVGGSNTTTMINGTAEIVIKNLIVDPADVTITFATHWEELYGDFTITGAPWNIYVSDYTVYYTGGSQNDDVFYVNVPATLNVEVQYNLTAVINSTPDYKILLNGNEIANGTFDVVNNFGSFEVNITPNEVGTITVVINDTTYHVSTTMDIPVKAWNVTSNYTVFNYGIYPDNVFYVSIPADLDISAQFTPLGIFLNSSVVVEVYDMNNNLLNTTVLPITDNFGSGTVLTNVEFNEPGYVLVKVYNDTYMVWTSYTIPIKDWGIYVSTTPANLTVGQTTDITVEVGESLQFPGSRNVNVTLELPDGYTETKTLTLEGPIAAGQGGYYGFVTFANITANSVGLAKIIVTDVLTGKTVTHYMLIEPSFTITNRYIEVTAMPVSSPVYAYLPNTLNIELQYKSKSGDYIFNEDINTEANVTIIDADGNVYTINYVPVKNGYVKFNYNIPVNGTNPIYIEAVDAYNASVVGVAMVSVETWNATFDFTTDGDVYQYVDNTLYVTVYVNGPSVPVDVTINGASVGSYSNGDVITVAIVDPQGTLTYNVEATYNGHVVGTGSYVIEPIIWNATIIVEPDMLYWGISDELHVSAEPTGNVPLIADDLNVDVSTNYGNASGAGAITILLTNPTDNVTGTVYVYYNGHLINSTAVSIPVESWDIIVQYTPTEFYYLPHGYANPPLMGNVTLSLPWDVASAANVGFEVSLPTLGIGGGSQGSNYFDIDFSWAPEKFVFNQSGVVQMIMMVFDPATNFTYFAQTYDIPIELALDATVSPQIAYVNVPFDLMVNVTSIAASPNITVTIDGTNYTATAYQNGVIVISDVVLEQNGIYTVVIHDNALNATITRALEVRDWHIEVTATPSNITAGSMYNVNFTIAFVDEMGDMVNITSMACLMLEFSNNSIIPSGFYTWMIPITEGHGAIVNAPIFAPVAGTFQIMVASKYGMKNDTETIMVNAPNPADLTYVYVNIRKEGSLEPPGEPVRLYWGIEIGGVKKYFPVYNPVYNADYSEGMFELYPQQPFNLYVIAVPSTINYPIVEEGQNYTWENVLQYVNETWYELNKTVTATSIDNGWSIMVNVSKYKVNLVNITKDIYNLQVTNVPGLIQIVPGSASVQGNAIFSGVTMETYHYEDFMRDLMAEPAEGATIITIEPNELALELLDDTMFKPTQAGEYFTFKAMLSITNAEEQFDAQWMPFEDWINNITFLNDTEKQEIIAEILASVGNVSELNGPVANETLDFHIDNMAIAYLEPTNATTDETGSAIFKVCTQATPDMTPEELITLMGAVDVWAAYDGLASNDIVVEFGGTSSISGDITDDSGNQVPGATVILKIWNGTTWVNATDFEGNVLTAVSAEDGHYAISNVPASVDGSKYMIVATKGNLTGYAYVTVYPFATSTADVKLRGTIETSGFAMYSERIANADTVYFIFNNLGTPDAFSTSQYIARTVPIDVRTKSVLADQFDFAQLTANDVLISVGGPLVNPVTAAYEDIAPVHMVVDGMITIVTPQGNFTWQPPTPWWNATKGYFIIQLFEDNSGALVVTIYGTDADSTAAGAYYFITQVSPNIDSYNGIRYIVGLWEDTEPGADVPLPGADLGDTSGFSAGDSITIVAEG